MTVWTFLSVLSNVFRQEELVTAEEHDGLGALLICSSLCIC